MKRDSLKRKPPYYVEPCPQKMFIWLDPLSILAIVSTLGFIYFKMETPAIILAFISLAFSSLKLFIKNDNKSYGLKIFNVIITVALIISLLFFNLIKHLS